jgi:endothelin-converting enzyme/putative endopeptidase
MRTVREQYKAHVAAMLKLAGFSDADARAARIIALETAIAHTHRTLAENENIKNANNTWTQADFRAKAPGLDWEEYFRGAGISHVESFIVWQPEAFTGESVLVSSTALETWKDWLAFHMIDAYAGVLPTDCWAMPSARFTRSVTSRRKRRRRSRRWWLT